MSKDEGRSVERVRIASRLLRVFLGAALLLLLVFASKTSVQYST